MPTETKFKQECAPENAQRFFHWIKTREGVANWKSVNLSNPGASWSTPVIDKEGKPYTKPNWQCANEPEIVTSAEEVGVYDSILYKAFPVALRRSGMSLKLTDASQRKLDKAMDQCEKDYPGSRPFYKKGVLDIEGASMGVYRTTQLIPLSEWIIRNGEGSPEEWE